MCSRLLGTKRSHYFLDFSPQSGRLLHRLAQPISNMTCIWYPFSCDMDLDDDINPYRTQIFLHKIPLNLSFIRNHVGLTVDFVTQLLGESDTDQNKNTIYKNARVMTVKNIIVLRSQLDQNTSNLISLELQDICTFPHLEANCIPRTNVRTGDTMV